MEIAGGDKGGFGEAYSGGIRANTRLALAELGWQSAESIVARARLLLYGRMGRGDGGEPIKALFLARLRDVLDGCERGFMADVHGIREKIGMGGWNPSEANLSKEKYKEMITERVAEWDWKEWKEHARRVGVRNNDIHLTKKRWGPESFVSRWPRRERGLLAAFRLGCANLVGNKLCNEYGGLGMCRLCGKEPEDEHHLLIVCEEERVRKGRVGMLYKLERITGWVLEERLRGIELKCFLLGGYNSLNEEKSRGVEKVVVGFLVELDELWRDMGHRPLTAEPWERDREQKAEDLEKLEDVIEWIEKWKAWEE